MRDVFFRLPAVLFATVALSGTIPYACAEPVTTMLPNGQRVVISDDGTSAPSSQPSGATAPKQAPVAPAEPTVAKAPGPAAPVPAAPAQPDTPQGPTQDTAVVFPSAAPATAAHPEGEATIAGPDTNPSLNPLSALAKASFVAFIEKPLFDPSRRLPPPVAPVQQSAQVFTPPPPPPDNPPNLHLIGVIQGERNIAVVHRGDETKTEMLSSGDEVDGWQVVVPPSLGLQLKKGDRVVDLKMFEVTPSGAPSTNVAQMDPDMMAAQAQARARHERPRPPRGY